MRATELPEEIQQLIKHLKNWDNLISEDVATILDKLYRGEELTRGEGSLDITPSELAAIWSVTNRTPIDARYVREVKRDGRIRPSKEWGKGPGYRCLYKVRTVKDIKITHEPGRPKGSKNKKVDKPAA